MSPSEAQPDPPLSFTTSPSINSINIPRAVFLASRPRIKALMAGAVVFCQPSASDPDSVDRILLVRRAASDSWPLLWEIPGGSVDETDTTVAAGAARELWEETGLRARHLACVVGMGLEDLAFETKGLGIEPLEEGAELDDDGLTVTFIESGGRWGRSTVMVEVENTDNVTVRPEEHADWAWASEEDIRRGWTDSQDGERKALPFISEAMIRILLESFRLRREMRAMPN